MTPYEPPLDEIRFILKRSAGLEASARLPGCETATPDLVDQVLAEGDQDLYLEIIRFEETRNYIRGIYEIFSIYRRLYDRTP